MKIQITDYIKSKCPYLVLGCISADVVVQAATEELNAIITELQKEKESLDMDKIKEITAIHHSREAYKALGKEPSRYRLSAEALHRRVVRGLGLYKINNVVDIINYISLKSGYSIGAYDKNKINGDITLDTGRIDDEYESIGRGMLNVENMPVLRDMFGAFGSPTSDSLRTMINEKTKEIFLLFYDFNKGGQLEDTLEETAFMLNKFAFSQNIFVVKQE